ncbi:Hypothetical protein, putative [Bodo saltans]|uniref:G-patch domain-containing protein n=1 Tax=Bodo saltans TaxID=75058 RepID=A0A0S4J7Y3_BODSA|nr:Hypothetical protein, putative [Bodo saltans]|eukprot:CUG86432.1 Hypothetical protein, putative [Bodo saltans]
MSAAAKKQMALMGWKEGQGLGKEGTGISSYVRVQKRDPKLQSGLGHEAGKSGSDNSDMGFDALLSTMAKKKDKKKRAATDSSDSEDDESKSKKTTSQIDTDGQQQDDADVTTASSSKQRTETSKKRARTPESSSSSSSDDDDEAGANGTGDNNILQWDDATLLKKCGGVRLGRAGRHRFFNGKLNRIDESHK